MGHAMEGWGLSEKGGGKGERIGNSASAMAALLPLAVKPAPPLPLHGPPSLSLNTRKLRDGNSETALSDGGTAIVNMMMS